MTGIRVVVGGPHLRREIDKAMSDLAAAADDALEATSMGLYDRGWAVARESQQRVPVDQGVLRASLDVTRPAVGDLSGVRVHYGGPASAYAAYQHEGGDGVRKVRRYSTPGTGPFFLSEPFEEEIAHWPERLVDAARRYL